MIKLNQLTQGWFIACDWASVSFLNIPKYAGIAEYKSKNKRKLDSEKYIIKHLRDIIKHILQTLY